MKCKECANGKRIDMPLSLTICRDPHSLTLAERMERANWGMVQSYRRPTWFTREEWGCDDCAGFVVLEEQG